MIAISIILPIYNVEQYIEKCLDSITNQSFLNYELIVIDDCGYDNSMKIIERKLNKSSINFKIIYNESNKGLSESRNIGIANSNSNFILFLDSDDWIDPLMLEKLYSAAIINDADLVSCRAMEFWEVTGEFTEMHQIEEGIYTPDNYLSLLFNGETSSHIWIRLIQRRLFKNIRFPEQVVYEDVLTFPYIIKNANKVVQIDDVLYYYLQRNSNTSITGSRPSNIKGFLYHFKKLQYNFEPTSKLDRIIFRKFIYKVLFVIIYNTIQYSTNYLEIKSDLKLIKSSIDVNELLKDLILLSKSIKINFLLYLLLLRINPMLLYLSHKRVLNRKKTFKY